MVSAEEAFAELQKITYQYEVFSLHDEDSVDKRLSLAEMWEQGDWIVIGRERADMILPDGDPKVTISFCVRKEVSGYISSVLSKRFEFDQVVTLGLPKPMHYAKRDDAWKVLYIHRAYRFGLMHQEPCVTFFVKPRSGESESQWEEKELVSSAI